MVDTTDNGFRAAIQSLREIVQPAIDPAHPMAREQVALVIDWLEFQRTRLPMLGERQRAELAANLAMARGIDALALPLGDAALDRYIVEAQFMLDRPASTYREASGILASLEEALGIAVRLASDLPELDRAAVERIVVQGSESILALQRAWFVPYGLEADPGSIPSLDETLAKAADPATNDAASSKDLR